MAKKSRIQFKMTKEELEAHLVNKKSGHVHKNKKKVIKRREKYHEK